MSLHSKFFSLKGPFLASALCILPLILTGCRSETGSTSTTDSASRQAEAQSAPAAPVVEVKATDFAFEIPEEIASGWTTFRMKNAGKQEHFMYIYRLPSEKTYEQFLSEAMVPFGKVWMEYAKGAIDREEAGQKLGAELPPWFFEAIVASGGPALTEPGETAQTTVRLSPGVHVVECYVKMPDGTWHTEMGMQQKLVVTEEETGGQPPRADVTLTLSNYAIETSGPLTAGEQTVAVEVTENPSGFMLHDINLVRLDDDVSLGDVVAWMDWMDLKQFRAPAPGHSLGGVEHMPAGETGYLTVDLTPGRYAWVSEGYGAQGMAQEFVIE